MFVYIVAFAFIIFDILTGLIKAVYTQKLNSTVLRKGLFHKLAEILSVIGAGLLEYGISYVNIGINVSLLPIVSAYICVMELISCMENLGEINPDLLKLFRPYLEKLKERDNNDENRKGD